MECRCPFTHIHLKSSGPRPRTARGCRRAHRTAKDAGSEGIGVGVRACPRCASSFSPQWAAEETPSAVSESAAYHSCLTLLSPASDSSSSWPPTSISSTVTARTPSRTSAKCALQTTTTTVLSSTVEPLSLAPLRSFSVACTCTSLTASRQAQRARERARCSPRGRAPLQVRSILLLRGLCASESVRRYI